jgi:hypothetical protein
MRFTAEISCSETSFGPANYNDGDCQNDRHFESDETVATVTIRTRRCLSMPPPGGPPPSRKVSSKKSMSR